MSRQSRAAYRWQQIPTSELSSTELAKEIWSYPQVVCARAWRMSPDGLLQDMSAVEVLYIPSISRAGIAWGTDVVWTDADSIDNALDRFFSVDWKALQP